MTTTNRGKMSRLAAVALLLAFSLGTAAGQIVLKAEFNIQGMKGTVTFTQQTPSGATTIEKSIAGMTQSEYDWQIRQFPTEFAVADRCSDAQIGTLFSSGGDLTQKHGKLSQSTQSFTDNSLKLSGAQSIAGRTLLISHSGSNTKACATVLPSAGIRMAAARFPVSVGGSVTFMQDEKDASANTAVMSDLFFLSSTSSVADMSWKIYSLPVEADLTKSLSLNQRCQNLGGAVKDLGAAHGMVKVGSAKGSERKLFTDATISLSGSNSVAGKSLVLMSANGDRVACANIAEYKPKSVMATFNMRNVTGTIKFAQKSPLSVTTVKIDLKNLDLKAGSFHVHKYPVPSRIQADDLCSNNAVGGHFNPFGITSSPAPGVGTDDQYEIGDLSGKFDTLSTRNFIQKDETDWNLPLFGHYSIVGRSIVIHRKTSGSRWVCATIGYPAGEVVTAIATFRNPVVGQMVFRQAKDDPLSDTSIYTHLGYADGSSESNKHSYHIHVRPITDDFVASTGHCQGVRGHYNPYEISTTGGYLKYCMGSNPLGCEIGDLSNKHGGIDIGGGSLQKRFFVTDTFLPLSGPYSSLKRSVTIHGANGGASRLACADLILKRPVIAKVTLWNDTALNGEISFMQDTLLDKTRYGISLDSMKNLAGGYHVHKYAVPTGVADPCSGTYTSGHFNPFNYDVGTSPTPGTGTTDMYEVGDLSGKFGKLTGKTKVEAKHDDYNQFLSGPNSIVGRSVVIHQERAGARWVCGNITEDSEKMGGKRITAISRFTGDIYGFIYLSQTVFPDGSFGDTSVSIKLDYKDASKKTVGHNYHIHDNPFGYNPNNPLCGKAGGHYNPFKVNVQGGYSTECSFSNQLRCELGDMSGKQGRYTIGGGQAFYTDVNLPLTGNYSVMGRSIVFHAENGGSPRITCADILPENALTVTTSFPVKQEPNKVEMVEIMTKAMDTHRWNVAVEILHNDTDCRFIKVHLMGDDAATLQNRFMKLMKKRKLGNYSPTDECSDSCHMKGSLLFVMAGVVISFFQMLH